MAAGGSLGAGQAAIVGERGPELFVPDSAGQVYSNTDSQAMLSPSVHVAAPVVPVTVVNVSDPDEVGDYLATQEGERAVLNVLRRNPSAVRQMTTRR